MCIHINTLFEVVSGTPGWSFCLCVLKTLKLICQRSPVMWRQNVWFLALSHPPSHLLVFHYIFISLFPSYCLIVCLFFPFSLRTLEPSQTLWNDHPSHLSLPLVLSVLFVQPQSSPPFLIIHLYLSHPSMHLHVCCHVGALRHLKPINERLKGWGETQKLSSSPPRCVSSSSNGRMSRSCWVEVVCFGLTQDGVVMCLFAWRLLYAVMRNFHDPLCVNEEPSGILHWSTWSIKRVLSLLFTTNARHHGYRATNRLCVSDLMSPQNMHVASHDQHYYY